MLNKLIPKGSNRREKLQDWYYNVHIPRKLSRNFIPLDNAKNELLLQSLVVNAFSSCKSYDSPEVLHEAAILAERFRDHRAIIIPWLDSVRSLKGLRILEIGCGNGTSTVALAEQGAIVTAIDIETGLLKDAQERCRIFGVSANFHLMNATEVAVSFADEEFDMILFYAVLEHMTYDERLQAIRDTYNMLRPGGLWCIIGTPNRLHYYDSHTAMMPFFYWLPDELAMKYASFSPRSEFRVRFDPTTEITEEKKMEFARWGRGMSYHEFELVLGELNQLSIESSLGSFLKRRDLMYRVAIRYTANGRYSTFLKKCYPTIHSAFFDPFLDLIISR